MSIRVKQRLQVLLISTTPDERAEIDREIEKRTGKPCDSSIDQITNAELRQIVELVRRKRKERPVMEAIA